jgi:hypothetical protein
MSDPDPSPSTLSTRDARLAAQMIRLSGARPDAHVLVAGRGNFDLFLALCRNGFSHARYETARGPRDRDDADILWVREVAPGGLDGVLALFARSLRAGGSLVAGLATVPTGERLLRLRRVLADAGFAMLLQEPQGEGAILLARKLGPASAARQAA